MASYSDLEVYNMYSRQQHDQDEFSRLAALCGLPAYRVREIVKSFQTKLKGDNARLEFVRSTIKQMIQNDKDKTAIYNALINMKGALTGVDFEYQFKDIIRSWRGDINFSDETVEELKHRIANGDSFMTIRDSGNFYYSWSDSFRKLYDKLKMEYENGVVDEVKEDTDVSVVKIGKLVKDGRKYTDESLALVDECILKGMTKMVAGEELEIPEASYENFGNLYSRRFKHLEDEGKLKDIKFVSPCRSKKELRAKRAVKKEEEHDIVEVPGEVVEEPVDISNDTAINLITTIIECLEKDVELLKTLRDTLR